MHASVALTTTLLLTTAQGSLQQTATATSSCPPTLRYIKLQSTTEYPISVFEVVALAANDGSNVASPSINPSATATQSSTLTSKNGASHDASLAIDGDLTTFTHTQSSTENPEWLQIDLGSSYTVTNITISNRWCGSVSDPTGCMCRMSQASLTLLDETGVGVVWEENLGDTCGKSEVKPMGGVTLASEQFCDASDGTGDVATTTGNGETSSNAMPTYLPTASPVVALPTFSADIFSSVQGESGEKAFPTYSPSVNNDSGTENDSLEGHAFSVGDKCEDDATFVSDKGITCVSFVYTDSVRCRSPTGMHDEEFDALRYSDFCPKTCGLCGDGSTQTNVSASTSEEGGNGVYIGVSLAISVLVLLVLTGWLCRENAKKSSAVPPSSSFRDSAEVSKARGEYRDDVGVKKPRSECTDEVSAVDEKISECVGEKIAETELV
ncbi:hypothetical protein HJC23_005995 [Cyclotella cryptica]|uniref:F5/8 type C domain-containing protein n=1 Tax=Cyclotella cryptica TaxID=29204 RepID=A0ABD3NWP7_9STRA|eukprot:CCRYP_019469-RA/>CCRYP_019469-RA protein AED:0.11 eAED:0.11 QI:0/-1/0/1/-1/1/1/0/437